LGIAAAIAQNRAAAKPIIDNERVTVWDITEADGLSGHKPAGDFVVVTVTPQPGAAYHAKGSAMDPIRGRTVIIDLKDTPVAPLQNTSGHPNAFPRPGATKLFENNRVIVWDYVWKPGVPSPMHFHDKDVVVGYVEDGALKSTTPDGQSTVNEFKAGTTRFNPRNRVHTEVMTSPRARAIITELK
jgi:quercetin dioxygenase-like cupin family protein